MNRPAHGDHLSTSEIHTFIAGVGHLPPDIPVHRQQACPAGRPHALCLRGWLLLRVRGARV